MGTLLDRTLTVDVVEAVQEVLYRGTELRVMGDGVSRV